MILRAHHFKVHFCGHCLNAHVIFYDENEVPLLEATMGADQAEGIAEKIRSRKSGDPPTGVFDVN